MIEYSKLGSHRRLNELVMAGSHDAGITKGGKNEATQDRDIFGQAIAGVRVFDLRIAATVVSGADGVKRADLQAIHADPKVQFKGSFKGAVSGLMPSRTQAVKTTRLPVGGTFGQSLTKMLTDARRFVESFSGEFLILKFDKSKNWALIAEACVALLGPRIYTLGGLINTRRQGDLAGQVVVLFTSDGFDEAGRAGYGPGHGILEVVNLQGGKTPRKGFAGLMYYGKGGTNPFKGWGKLKDNQKKQAKLMQAAGDSDPDVLGMMYWTTTGLFESIRKRDQKMWNTPNVENLQKLWSSGLSVSYTDRLGGHVDLKKPRSAMTLKMFMPNIVMIDFADPFKCMIIHDLNTLSATALSQAVQGFGDD